MPLTRVVVADLYGIWAGGDEQEALLWRIGDDGAYAAWRGPRGVQVFRIEFLAASLSGSCLVRFTTLRGDEVARAVLDVDSLLDGGASAGVVVRELLCLAAPGDGPLCPFPMRPPSATPPPGLASLAAALEAAARAPREPILVLREVRPDVYEEGWLDADLTFAPTGCEPVHHPDGVPRGPILWPLEDQEARRGPWESLESHLRAGF